jgi:phosphoribosylformylglycinamidine synthase
VRRPEQADAAVLVLDPTPGADAGRDAIAVSIDGNGRRVAVDPYRGAVEAVLECSANLACVGAEPLGLTNCLNFGNPEKPHIAWQLEQSVRGLGDACRALGVPVVGGNVSLYNEGPEGPIYPTPVVGMVGELPAADRSGRLGFAQDGDAIAVISASWAPSLTGSELAKLRGEALEGDLPHADLGEISVLHAAVRRAVRSGSLRSAHDVAEGGLLVALAECCIAGGRGARVELDEDEAALFGEGPGAFVVSGPASAFAAFGAAARVIGEVGGSELDAGAWSVPVEELSRVHASGLASLLH